MSEIIKFDLNQIKSEKVFFRVLELLGFNRDGNELTKVDPKAIYEVVIESIA